MPLWQTLQLAIVIGCSSGPANRPARNLTGDLGNEKAYFIPGGPEGYAHGQAYMCLRGDLRGP